MSTPDRTRAATDPSAGGLVSLTDPSTTAPGGPDARSDDGRPVAPLPRDAAADRLAAAVAGVAAAARRRVAGAARAVAFWLASLLPLTYLPALVTGAAGERPLALLCVLSGHAAALVLGRGYAAGGDADLVAADGAR